MNYRFTYQEYKLGRLLVAACCSKNQVMLLTVSKLANFCVLYAAGSLEYYF